MSAETWPVFIARTLLVACVGVTMEIVFTAFMDRKKHSNWRLMGQSYVWMIPIYMMVYPGLTYLQPMIAGWGPLSRGLLYMALIFAGEYASGLVLRWTTGACPWDYGHAKWAVHGLIRLDYGPAWFAASMVFETAFRILRG